MDENIDARLPPGLTGLVVKDGVRLGGLAARDLTLALAWVAAGVPAGRALDEPAVNAALKAALAGPACWLDTDHVELRRWLVDAGWLARDGFGREYRRVDASALPAPLADLAAALDGVDTARWTRMRRASHADARAQRRADWAARSEGPA